MGGRERAKRKGQVPGTGGKGPAGGAPRVLEGGNPSPGTGKILQTIL